MRTIINLWLGTIIILSVVSAPAHALVVTDPTSYSYYVEQIKSATDTLKQAKENTETLGGVLEETEGMRANLEGNYNMLGNAINDIGALRNAESAIPNINSLLSLPGTGSMDNREKTLAALKTVFSDPTKDTYNPWIVHDAQGYLQQASKRNAIVHSNALLSSVGERLESLSGLAEQVDRTPNAKAAVDLTNRLLVEIIRGNIEMLMVLTRMEEMMALQDYKGVPEEAPSVPTTTHDRPDGKPEGLREQIQRENAARGFTSATDLVESLM